MLFSAIPNYICTMKPCIGQKKADLSSLLLTQCIHSISDKPECAAGHPNSAASASAIATVGVAPRQETEVMQASIYDVCLQKF